MISEEQLKKATLEAEEILMAPLPDLEACDHEFSPAFERKMKKLIRRRKHPVLAKPLFRVAAAILLVVLLGGIVILAVPEVKASFVGLFYEEKEDQYRYVLSGYVDECDLRTYHLGYVPEGYTLTDEKHMENGGTVKYVASDGSPIIFYYIIQREGKECSITFGQILSSYELTDTIVNGRGADLYINESKFGKQNKHVIWMNEERSILFSLIWMHTEEDVTILAESVIAREPEE